MLLPSAYNFMLLLRAAAWLRWPAHVCAPGSEAGLWSESLGIIPQRRLVHRCMQGWQCARLRSEVWRVHGRTLFEYDALAVTVSDVCVA